MAITFSRPDPSSPGAVGSAQFNIARRGYDQGEVRDFLRMVSAELARLQERERFLESEMRAMQTRGLSDPGVLDEATVTTLLGEETARVLSVAREAAQQMRMRAAETAERLVREATSEVARLREEAEIENERRRSDALDDSESEIELAKQQGREMINEARAYKEKMLTELARRRELAKQQIEQLVRDRDRLMSAFERARLAANDVMGDLTEFDEAAGDLKQAIPEGVVDESLHNVVLFDREKFEDDTLDNLRPEVAKFSDFESAQQIEQISLTTNDKELTFAAEEPFLTSSADLETESLVEPEVMSEVEPEIKLEVQPEVEIEIKAEAQPEIKLNVKPEPDEGHRANVIQLFGRTSRRLHPSTDAPPSEVPDVKPEVIDTVQALDTNTKSEQKPAVLAPKKSNVDDLFAKLREAGASSVASSIKQAEPVQKKVVKSDPSNTTASTASTTSQTPVSVKPDPQIFTKRDEVLAPIVEALSKKFKRVLADEENSVLNYLQNKKAQVALETVLPSFDSQVQSFVEATSKDLIEAAMAGAQSLSKSLKADLRKKISNTTVMQVMSKKLADAIVLPLRTRIQKCVEKSAGDTTEMSSLIRTVYREWKMQQIDKLVSDIARLAYSRGAYLVLDAGTKVCWMVDPNGPACSDAEDNSLAGTIALGENFPTGHEHPVVHSGCRCLVVPTQR
jgi:DivIVA domain-containing protein